MKKYLILLFILIVEMVGTMAIGGQFSANGGVCWLVALISSGAILIATALILTVVLCEERINEKKDE